MAFKGSNKAAYQREYMRKRRGSQNTGSQDKGSQSIDEGQRLHPGAALGAVVLSDGQLWYPGHKRYHSEECRCNAHPHRGNEDDSCKAAL